MINKKRAQRLLRNRHIGFFVGVPPSEMFAPLSVIGVFDEDPLIYSRLEAEVWFVALQCLCESPSDSFWDPDRSYTSGHCVRCQSTRAKPSSQISDALLGFRWFLHSFASSTKNAQRNFSLVIEKKRVRVSTIAVKLDFDF